MQRTEIIIGTKNKIFERREDKFFTALKGERVDGEMSDVWSKGGEINRGIENTQVSCVGGDHERDRKIICVTYEGLEARRTLP